MIQTGVSLARIFASVILLISFYTGGHLRAADPPMLNNKGYFEKQGLNILVFSNFYDGNFSDAKISGIEIIHHGIRTVTNGDVRLNSTPGQWDPVPELIDRNVSIENQRIETSLKYPKYDFTYRIRTEAYGGGVRISVILDKPLPDLLQGKAGLNLEFLPSAYFEKTYLMDNKSGVFPLYPEGSMFINQSGKSEPLPDARGKSLILSPEDITTHISVHTSDGELLLFDGRNQAQNGWFVVRTLIPSNKTGKVIE